MSTALLTSTSFVGLDISIMRMAKWETRVQENVSGKETRVTYRTIPRWSWQLKFNFLRNSTSQAAFGNSTEFASFVDFFNSRGGGFDSFQWQDPEDFNAITQSLNAITPGVYQLQRTLLTFNEPIYAPQNVTQVWVAGSSASTAGITGPGFWQSSNPGQITLSTSTPSTTTVAFASFTYAWPVRFDADTMEFERLVSGMWAIKKTSWTSII